MLVLSTFFSTNLHTFSTRCVVTPFNSRRDCYCCCTDALEGVYRTKLLLRGVEGEFDCNCILHFPVCRCYASGTHVASFRHGNHNYTNNQLKEKQLFLYIGAGTIDLIVHMHVYNVCAQI